MKYRIIDILHSGRLGIRDTRVDDEKYIGMIGSVIRLVGDLKLLEDIKQFEQVMWHFVAGQSGYTWWITSEVIQLSRDPDGLYTMETVNTIYILEQLS